MSAANPAAEVPDDIAKAGWLADTDEVAAILEASGVNDRIAAEKFGHSSVFTLARRVMRDSSQIPSTLEQPRTRYFTEGLVRAFLYLTPAALSIGYADVLTGLPWYATTGPLVAGWGVGQALAYLGYCAVNEAATAIAARRLAAGFGVLLLAWFTLLWQLSAGLESYLICTVQFAMFTAITGALVTRTERSTLAAAVGCWIAAFFGLHPIVLAISLLTMLAVAYRPALTRHEVRWQPGLSTWLASVSYAIVGVGQACLFVVVVLRDGALALSAIPLLLGIPLTEMLMVWHRRQVARGRATFTTRPQFAAYLKRLSRHVGLALLVPVVIAVWASSGVAVSLGLVAVNAVCLVLVEHRSRQIAMLLVWLPIPLLQTILIFPHAQTESLLTVILICSFLIALPQAMLVIRDPRSYS